MHATASHTYPDGSFIFSSLSSRRSTIIIGNPLSVLCMGESWHWIEIYFRPSIGLGICLSHGYDLNGPGCHHVAILWRRSITCILCVVRLLWLLWLAPEPKKTTTSTLQSLLSQSSASMLRYLAVIQLFAIPVPDY